jgi:hypothetical protein
LKYPLIQAEKIRDWSGRHRKVVRTRHTRHVDHYLRLGDRRNNDGARAKYQTALQGSKFPIALTALKFAGTHYPWHQFKRFNLLRDLRANRFDFNDRAFICIESRFEFSPYQPHANDTPMSPGIPPGKSII